MITLVWSSSFVRALKRKTRRSSDLRDRIEETLRRLAEDPFHPSLRTHKLTGQLSGTWACRVSYEFVFSLSSFRIQSPARRRFCC
jgi:addiction module RelE/StbE family toxin